MTGRTTLFLAMDSFTSSSLISIENLEGIASPDVVSQGIWSFVGHFASRRRPSTHLICVRLEHLLYDRLLGGAGGGEVLAFLFFFPLSFPVITSIFWTFPVRSPQGKSTKILQKTSCDSLNWRGPNWMGTLALGSPNSRQRPESPFPGTEGSRGPKNPHFASPSHDLENGVLCQKNRFPLCSLVEERGFLDGKLPFPDRGRWGFWTPEPSFRGCGDSGPCLGSGEFSTVALIEPRNAPRSMRRQSSFIRMSTGADRRWSS